MDITTSSNKIKTSKYFNGETVNYSLFYSLGFLAFLIIKQVLKTFVGLGAKIAMPISFVLVMLVLFFVEKKFVFNHNPNTKTPKQIIAYIFRCGVDFGFYKIFEFAFVSMLDMHKIIPYLFSIILIFVFNFYFDRLVVFDVRSNPLNNKNGRLFKLAFNNRFVLASMGIATLGISFVFLIYKLFPFGDLTVLRMDLYHQYGPLFVEFYDRIVNFKSFLYSWQSGGGSSFLGNFFNYLSSPLSLIVLLFDKKQIGYAITTLVMVKGVLSSATFTYFLKKSFNRHSPVTAAFGVFYAFSGYFLAYYWNIMWIDGMILLPLIALGIENIINKGNAKLYIISLAVLLYSSYYMGYMACIFSVFYFLMYFFAYNNSNDVIKATNDEKQNIVKKALNNKFIASGLRFAFASLFIGAICACFLLPIYFILQSCSATSDSFPTALDSNFNLIDMFSSHLDGLETTIRSSGDDVLPNISSGMLAVILLPLYLMNKDIRLKEKVSYMLMMIFLIVSFDCNILEFIWHAFHFPNDLPFRFSYMYVFIMLIIAFRGLMHIKSIRYQDVVVTSLVLALVIMLYQKFPTNKISELSIYISLVFVIVWCGVLLLIKKGYASKFIIGVTILCMTFCEVIISDSNSYLFTVEQENYTHNYDAYTEAFDYLAEKDKGFYRAELTYLDTRMDPSLYSYDGMSIFSSMAYEDFSQAQFSQGMAGNRINSFTYNTQTPVYNMLNGIKYLVKAEDSIEPSSNYYKKIHTLGDDKTSIYKNNYFLPIAFLTSPDVQDWDSTEGNPFDVQENLFDLATGLSDCFVPAQYVETSAPTIICEEVSENGTYEFSDVADEEYGTIDITIKNVLDSNLYVYVTSSYVENVDYYWNFDEDTTNQNIDEPYIMDLGAFKKGDEVRVSLDLSSVDSTSGTFSIYAYNVDKEVLDTAYEFLNLGKLNATSFNDTEIEGTINAGYDGYLYTSIPYDEGWKVYIDGQEQLTFSIGESNLATTIKHGERKVKFVYQPAGQKKGIIISLCALIALAGYEVLKRKNPFSKVKMFSNDNQ